MPQSPHDRFFKEVFGQVEHAASYFREELPPALLGLLDLATLEKVPGSFVDVRHRDRYTDLVFRVGLDGRDAFLYLLFEHQSTDDPLIAFRLLRYMVCLWDEWLSDHPGATQLPPIVPLVLYHGLERWSAGTRLRDIIAADEALRAAADGLMPDFGFCVKDLGSVPEAELRGSAVAVLTLGLLKISRRPDFAALLPRWSAVMRDVVATSGLRGLRAAIEYVLEVRDEVTPEALGEFLDKEVEQGAREVAMTTAERLRAEGRVEGRAEGRAEGRRAVLLRQMRLRFGTVPEEASQRIEGATSDELDWWAERILLASSLEDLLAGGEPPQPH